MSDETPNGARDTNEPEIVERHVPGQPRPRRQVGRRPAATNPSAASSQLAERSYSEDVAEDPREVKFAEWQVAALFLVGAAMAIAFVVFYVTVPIHRNIGQLSNYALGGSLALSLAAVGAGFIIWAKKLLPHEKAVQDRHEFQSLPAEEAAAEETFFQGIDDIGLGRYKVLRRSLLGVLALLPIPAVMLARDLGPLPHGSLDPEGEITAWKKGDRLVDSVTKVPYKLGDIDVGGIATVMPEGFDDINDESLAPTILIRFAPGQIKSAKELKWSASDHVAYSKVCTHAGCPISLYEQQTHHLLCPCHQSTFDMSRDAKVVFGPAARPLPQLQIYIDQQGYFRASGPYSQPVGPSFWERR
jgi:ubiquinol-cytochrome c reductase iron-sulfur subunit